MKSLIKIREADPLPDPGNISALDIANARRIAEDIFHPYGISVPGYLIRSDSNKKLSLEIPGYQGIAALTLTPATHGPATTCAFFKHCKDLCVLTHGRGAFESVIKARSARVSLLLEAPEAASILLAHDVDRYSRAWDKWGLRLNVASDLAWEIAAPWLIDRAKSGGASVYDYSKRWDREPEPLPGYRLTFSAAGHSIEEITDKVSTGANVAIVLPIDKDISLPDRWHDIEVIDGDLHDLRALDPRGVIVGLRAKGKAIHSVGSKLIYEVA